MKKLLSFLQGGTNESLKRLIALLFALTLIVLSFFGKYESILSDLVYGMFTLIALLLGLATAETIVNVFQNKNNSKKED